MRIWTIQPAEVWKALQRNSVVYVDPARRGYPDEYIPESYLWLLQQLRTRVADYPNTLPWWAYCRKPDLRLHRHSWPSGSAQIRIELEVAQSQTISFPCWAWDTVFSGDFLAFSRREYEDWMRRLRHAITDEDLWPLPEPWCSELEASWLRLFDHHLPLRSWDVRAFASDPEAREAVLGALWLSDVRRVTPFAGSSRMVIGTSPWLSAVQ